MSDEKCDGDCGYIRPGIPAYRKSAQFMHSILSILTIHQADLMERTRPSYSSSTCPRITPEALIQTCHPSGR
jgi:hypothetical protein